MLDIHSGKAQFQIGKAIIVEEGEDVALIATGETVQRAFLASQILKGNNINSTIVSMHTIKPFDSEAFLKIAKKSKVIVSIEEHSEFGGLGEQCASLLAQNQINTNFKIIGIPDEYMVNGSQSDVLDHYNMSPEKIANITKSLID